MSIKTKMNKQLLGQIALDKQVGMLSAKLTAWIRQIIEMQLRRSRYKFHHVLMRLEAIKNCSKSILKFDETKSQNPFVYLVRIINGSFSIVISRANKRYRTLTVRQVINKYFPKVT